MSDEFEQWLSEASKERVTVEVCLDRALLGEFVKAADELADARRTSAGMMRDPDEVQRLSERVVELDDQVRERTRTLVFGNLPRNEWENLRSEYRASDEVRAENKRKLAEQREVDPRAQMDVGLDWDAFAPAAIAASCVDPGMSLAQAKRLEESLPPMEWNRIFQSCLRANSEGTHIPKSVSGIVAKLRSDLNSTSAESEESPSPSSEDGS